MEKLVPYFVPHFVSSSSAFLLAQPTKRIKKFEGFLKPGMVFAYVAERYAGKSDVPETDIYWLQWTCDEYEEMGLAIAEKDYILTKLEKERRYKEERMCKSWWMCIGASTQTLDEHLTETNSMVGLLNTKNITYADIQYLPDAIEIVTHAPDAVKQRIKHDLSLEGALFVSNADIKQDRWSTADILFNLRYPHTVTDVIQNTSTFVQQLLKIKGVESIRICTPRGVFVFTETNIQDLADAIAKYTK